MHMRPRVKQPFRAPLALLVILAALVVPTSALGDTFTNPTPITIVDNSPASVYPSTITPTGLTGAVTKVTVTLHSLSHEFLSDMDILVVAPNGAAAILWSDACYSFQTTAPVEFTFDDAAAAPPLATGCVVIPIPMKPINYPADDVAFGCGTDPDVFPTPAPPGPSSGGYPTGLSMLSVFNGMGGGFANGIWQLFVRDDCGLSVGSIAGGWSLDITMGPPLAVSVLSFSARAVPGRVDLSWRTASETRIAGFNVFRTGPAGTAKVNRSLVEAVGVFGGSYRLVDRTVRAGTAYTYRLQIVYRDGTRGWYRTVRATARR